ncbi:peptidase M28 [Bacteroidetes bacterium UKL13-3]|jgi:carboxypeptidase Q|nr:peptidase M28 [Bacteroidetes bacterium UKL13-3]HCP92695.1 peptidase M28 family protein [Bacteroidota bacterium]
MNKFLSAFLLSVSSLYAQAQSTDSVMMKRIYNEVLTRGKCYENLDYLSNKIGGRLSGSLQAQQAVDYTFGVLKSYGFDSVYLQELMVPHWVRGAKEIGMIVKGTQQIPVHICALGNSIATPKDGLRAPVIEVRNFKELEAMGTERVKGKIVFFNRPMEPTHITTGRAYGEAGDQRGSGAIEAAKYGAVGVVVRSLTLANDTNPHTGMMRYVDSIPKIPACAISTKDADELSRLLKIRSAAVVSFFFKQNCEMLPDVKSYNVIAEMRGNEKPEEIVIAGGHLDSWDNGDGAHDDGAGVTQSMEALRLLKHLNYKPKRTLRCVLFMNEENGVKGGIKYADEATGTKHIAAIESDAGGFTPRGFGLDDSITIIMMQKWVPLFQPYSIDWIKQGWGGTDIGPLKKHGTVLIGYTPDSQRYFDYHHAAIDTFDKVNKRELELGAAAISSMLYLLSEYGIGK